MQPIQDTMEYGVSQQLTELFKEYADNTRGLTPHRSPVAPYVPLLPLPGDDCWRLDPVQSAACSTARSSCARIGV